MRCQIHPFDHDYVVWLGDLNYRIDSSLSVEAVNEQVDSGDFSVLRAMDQLNMERDDGRVFEGFLEGVLEFPPTYKFNPKTDEYERRAEKKQRAPAWCDRVLWKDSRLAYGHGAHSIDLTSYSCSRIITSDHKPVIATFDIGVSKVSALRLRHACACCMGGWMEALLMHSHHGASPRARRSLVTNTSG